MTKKETVLLFRRDNTGWVRECCASVSAQSAPRLRLVAVAAALCCAYNCCMLTIDAECGSDTMFELLVHAAHAHHFTQLNILPGWEVRFPSCPVTV